MKKRDWRIFLLNILDPARHDRGKIWFERPGCICFNVDYALKKQRQRAAKVKMFP